MINRFALLATTAAIVIVPQIAQAGCTGSGCSAVSGTTNYSSIEKKIKATVTNKDATEVWTGSMMNDHVTRLDVKTGQSVDYLLPRPTNIRRVFVEETGRRPLLWVGSNHGASIVRVEPLD